MPVLSEDYGDALANDGVTYSDDFVFGEDESVLLGTLQMYPRPDLVTGFLPNFVTVYNGRILCFYKIRNPNNPYNSVLKVSIVA